MGINASWELWLKNNGADFVHFVDIAGLVDGEYSCALLFGRAISKEYIRALQAGRPPKTKEVINSERKMDVLAAKLAAKLEAEGHKAVAKLKFGLLPHKTIALKAGLGFIGKNNLLVTQQYGCAVVLGKVLTTAPFAATSKAPTTPECGDCSICVDACPTNTLHGKTWDANATRDQMMLRKTCILCHSCMISCPYTAAYAK
ncbi:MAG: 4Fe-4S dicluster domain-containing protein [Defluviitaleaceae bacterium]|nr:4Fe-4S dicluster domain-containing protein [Defluviitaleaceae bacterium]